LLVILTLLCVFLLVFGPVTLSASAKAKRIRCVNNLKTVGLVASTIPTSATTDRQALADFESFLTQRMLSFSNSGVSVTNFTCPADSRKQVATWAAFSRTNFSYFVSLDSAQMYPQTLLAGDRNIMTNGARIGPGIVKLDSSVTNAAWDGTIHRFQGNCVMGDGSVQQLSSVRLRDSLRNTGLPSTTVAVP
jgi:hypothetical protein